MKIAMLWVMVCINNKPFYGAHDCTYSAIAVAADKCFEAASELRSFNNNTSVHASCQFPGGMPQPKPEGK